MGDEVEEIRERCEDGGVALRESTLVGEMERGARILLVEEEESEGDKGAMRGTSVVSKQIVEELVGLVGERGGGERKGGEGEVEGVA